MRLPNPSPDHLSQAAANLTDDNLIRKFREQIRETRPGWDCCLQAYLKEDPMAYAAALAVLQLFEVILEEQIESIGHDAAQ